MNSILAIPVDATASMLAFSTGQSIIAGALANVLSNRYGSVVRIGTGATGTYSFTIDLGSARTITPVLAVLWSNLRSGDQVQLLAGTTLGGSDLYNSGAVGAYASTSRITSAGTKSLIASAVATVTARYWQINIIVNTTALPEGYLQISRLMIGDRINFSVDYTTLDILDDDRGGVDQSDYGEDIEDARRISFGLRPRWRFGSEAEMLASHLRLTARGKTKPILFCPIPGAANAQDLIAFGKMRNAAKSSSAAYDIWEMSFEIYSEAA